MTPSHNWTVAPRVDSRDNPTVTPARQLHLYRLPDKDREDQDLADTTCLREDQWRTLPKAVNKTLKSLSHSWPSRTDAYPTFEDKKRKKSQPLRTKGPGPKRTRMQSITEEMSDDDDQHDDESAAQPPAPEEDPDPEKCRRG